MFYKYVQTSFVNYKEQFMNIIILQNQLIEGEIENVDIKEKFFSLESFEKIHFFSNSNDWPDLGSIILQKDFWNVDITKVDPNEYKDVHFCIFKINQTRFSNNEPKYGPVDGKFYMDKFMEDFQDAVDSLFIERKIQIDFKITVFSQATKELIEESCPLYVEFLSLIRKYINSSNYGAIKLLKIPIAILYNINPDDYERDAKILAEGFEKVYPYWEKYYLQ